MFHHNKHWYSSITNSITFVVCGQHDMQRNKYKDVESMNDNVVQSKVALIYDDNDTELLNHCLS
jgi:transketolase